MTYKGTKWAERLNYLVTVEPGWLDGEGEAIRPEVLERADEILKTFDSSAFRVPALFPLIEEETNEGGISMEWQEKNNPNRISLQISNSFSYWVFVFNLETRATASLETDSIKEAHQLLRDNLIRVGFVSNNKTIKELK